MCPESTPNPADAGCNSKLAQYSNTPILHHSAWPDSRTRTKHLTRGTRWAYRSVELARQYRFVSLAPLSGRVLGTINPGLKPWAKLWSPFRAKGLAGPLIDVCRSDPVQLLPLIPRGPKQDLRRSCFANDRCSCRSVGRAWRPRVPSL
jgi:hypothetical protein